MFADAKLVNKSGHQTIDGITSLAGNAKPHWCKQRRNSFSTPVAVTAIHSREDGHKWSKIEILITIIFRETAAGDVNFANSVGVRDGQGIRRYPERLGVVLLMILTQYSAFDPKVAYRVKKNGADFGQERARYTADVMIIHPIYYRYEGDRN